METQVPLTFSKEPVTESYSIPNDPSHHSPIPILEELHLPLPC